MKKVFTTVIDFNLKKTLFLLSLFIFSGMLYANNVEITGMSYSNTDEVSFDVSWDNSWRNTGTPGSTENYDGVWIFVKFRDACAKDSLEPSTYSHMWLDTDVNAHTVPSNAAIEIGTTNIGGTDRGMGVFIYRDTDGFGTFSVSNITLKWDQLAQGVSGTDWDIKVFAFEMVYIPEGSFYVGDASSSNYLKDGSTTSPFLIDSENAITMGTAAGSLNQVGTNLSGTLPANFPKGFDAFWVMKYEITQQQYVEYLNTLSRTDQNSAVATPVPPGIISIASSDRYVMSRTISPSFRNGIRMPETFHPTQPIEFFNDLNYNGIENEINDGQTIACNFITNAQMRRFLIWSALRPMSELEFEKICRGPESVYGGVITNELAWSLAGNMPGTFTSVAGVVNSGAPDELPNNTGIGLVHNSSNPNGPIRVGATYTSATDRLEAGSSYYGVADMSGNVYEFVIRVTSNNSFSGAVYGNGGISWNNPAGWTIHGYRGGAFGFGSSTAHLPTSSRVYSSGSSIPTTSAGRNTGGRGAR
ncbi:MAG: hypothetical protein EA412_03555 [Chitinophagaceae bacterium]|nr:MAG: hypothetical protein EA412_03555 [Chitinophagaceae bacterium]